MVSCIYRNNKTFAICSKACIGDGVFCMKHKNAVKQIYEIFYEALGRNEKVGVYDIYKIFKYIWNAEIDTENAAEIKKKLFIEVIKKLPKGLIQDASGRRTKEIYERLYELNKKTYEFGDENALKLQKYMKQWFVKKVQEYDREAIINKEDPFTYDDIDEIDKTRLFVYGAYAFDAVDLAYFVDKCEKDDVVVYNPFTREEMDSRSLCRLKMFMNYNGLTKKSEHVWQTEGQAFTDLSMEIEKQGFYNSPDWFMKMDKKTLIKVVKLFKDFSADVRASHGYFLEFKKDSFVFDFCREGMRMFSECKDDLYILCCNFMKALAMYSRDFYLNMPEWLASMNTSSRISNYSQRFNMNMYGNNSDNFLLYYYVEYMQ